MTTTFQLDTSGVVYDNRHGEIAGRARTEWSDLSPFTQGYIEALFASSWGDIGGTHFLTTREVKDFGYTDLAPETLARIIADCEVMRARLGDRFADGLADPTEEGAGKAFWKLRQKALYADFPPLTVTLGDDGKVRFQ